MDDARGLQQQPPTMSATLVAHCNCETLESECICFLVAQFLLVHREHLFLYFPFEYQLEGGSYPHPVLCINIVRIICNVPIVKN